MLRYKYILHRISNKSSLALINLYYISDFKSTYRTIFNVLATFEASYIMLARNKYGVSVILIADSAIYTTVIVLFRLHHL